MFTVTMLTKQGNQSWLVASFDVLTDALEYVRVAHLNFASDLASYTITTP